MDAIVNSFKVYQRAERPPPAYAGHLMTTMSTRILAAFDSNDALKITEIHGLFDGPRLLLPVEDAPHSPKEHA